MSHQAGAWIGGIRDLDGLRGRCVIKAGCECWHLRTPRGKEWPRAKTLKVWAYGRGAVSAARLAWELNTGKPFPDGNYVAARICDSTDCCNPQHIRAWTKQQHFDWLRKEGRTVTARKQIANRLAGAKRSRVPPELRRWIAESPQTPKELAPVVGVSPSHVYLLRRQMREAML